MAMNAPPEIDRVGQLLGRLCEKRICNEGGIQRA